MSLLLNNFETQKMYNTPYTMSYYNQISYAEVKFITVILVCNKFKKERYLIKTRQ